MALSGRVVALLAVGALPLVLIAQWWVLGAWAALVVLTIVADLVLAASPRRAVVQRRTEGPVRLDESTTSTLYVTNTGRRRMRGIVRDAWPPSARAEPTRHRLNVPRGERRAYTLRLTPFRRGERAAAGVTLRTFGPLGLAARQATIAAPGAVLVLPAFRSRKHLPSRLARLRELEGATPLMLRGQGTEFDSLRDYVRGDDVRSIDWRASARRRDPLGGQKLVVRTWRPERDRRVVIIADSGRTAAARIEDEVRLDTAFEASLLLGALASRAGDRVDFLAFDRRVRARVQGATGADLMNRMVTAMAPVDPELIETDWAAVPGLVRSITSQRSLVVLATNAESPGASRALLAMLPQLTRQHVVVVTTVTDPAVADAASVREDRASVYRAASAERTLLDAARVADAVRRLGADVVAGRPEQLPPALADHYIALKASGRL